MTAAFFGGGLTRILLGDSSFRCASFGMTPFIFGGSQARAQPAPDSLNHQSAVIPSETLSEAKGQARNLPDNIMYLIFIWFLCSTSDEKKEAVIPNGIPIYRDDMSNYSHDSPAGRE